MPTFGFAIWLKVKLPVFVYSSGESEGAGLCLGHDKTGGPEMFVKKFGLANCHRMFPGPAVVQFSSILYHARFSLNTYPWQLYQHFVPQTLMSTLNGPKKYRVWWCKICMLFDGVMTSRFLYRFSVHLSAHAECSVGRLPSLICAQGVIHACPQPLVFVDRSRT